MGPACCGNATDPLLLTRRLAVPYDGASTRAGIGADDLRGLAVATATTLIQAAGITDCPAAAFRPLRADTRSSLDLSCEVGCAALLRRLDVRTPYLGMEGLDLTHGNDGSYVAHGFDAENPDAPMYTGVE
ncbi:hypothetical protein ACWEQ1_30105 [Streptomyces nodosus]